MMQQCYNLFTVLITLGCAMTDWGGILQAMPSAVLVVGADDCIQWANPAAEVELERSLTDLCSKTITQVLGDDSTLHRAMALAQGRQQTIRIDQVSLPIRGHDKPYYGDVFPLTGMGKVAIMLHPIQHQRGFFTQHTRTKGAMHSAIGLSDMLCHEIKNPLAGIAGAAQLLSATANTDDRELTELIVDETRRINALLDQVEQIGNTPNAAFMAENIHTVLDRAVASAAVGFAGHIRFAKDYDPSLPLVPAQSDALVQVFLNLIKNAAEAQANAGTITLKTYYDASMRMQGDDGTTHPLPINIEVADTGPGVPPDLLDMLFDPFVSGKRNGTGLGLALCSKIIGDHKGTIFVQSAPGNTVFRISLPMAAQQKD